MRFLSSENFILICLLKDIFFFAFFMKNSMLYNIKINNNNSTYNMCTYYLCFVIYKNEYYTCTKKDSNATKRIGMILGIYFGGL